MAYQLALVTCVGLIGHCEPGLMWEDEVRETGTLSSLSKLGKGPSGTPCGDSSHLGFLDRRAACLAGGA